MKKLRNKAYRPKPVSKTSWHEAFTKRQTLDDDQQTDLSVAYRLAFQQMVSGHADEENWCVVVLSLNIALVLAEWGIGEEYIDRINGALEGAFRAKIRAGRTGKWGFDGEAIQAIKDVFEIHEEQLKLASKHEITSSLQEVHRRADAGHVFTEEVA